MHVSPTAATFLFELLNFLLLAGALGWLLFKPVRERIQARQAADRQHADEIAARTAEAARLQAEWQQRTEAFEREMTETRAARLSAAEHDAKAVVAQAREAAERERQRAAGSLAQIEDAQVQKLADAVAGATRESVARLLAAIDAPALESALVRNACARLHSLDGDSLGDVLVESSQPLADGDRAELAAALNARASTSTFRVTPSLGAGLRVTTARGLIDASSAGLAAEAERRLRAELTK